MSALAGEEIERVDINEEEVKNQQALERAEKAGIKANFGYRTEFMLDIAEGKESAFNAENFHILIGSVAKGDDEVHQWEGNCHTGNSCCTHTLTDEYAIDDVVQRTHCHCNNGRNGVL
jgi:hypothetical protein